MRIMDFLAKEAITHQLKAKGKKEAIEELVELLVKAGRLEGKNKEKVIKALIEREELGSTGIGEGIAIPHAKSEAVKKMAASFGRSSEGVNFDALDNKPVHLLFLLVAPEDASSEHIKALAKISRLLKHKYFRSALKKADSAEEITRIIVEEESLV